MVWNTQIINTTAAGLVTQTIRFDRSAEKAFWNHLSRGVLTENISLNTPNWYSVILTNIPLCFWPAGYKGRITEQTTEVRCLVNTKQQYASDTFLNIRLWYFLIITVDASDTMLPQSPCASNWRREAREIYLVAKSGWEKYLMCDERTFRLIDL